MPRSSALACETRIWRHDGMRRAGEHHTGGAGYEWSYERETGVYTYFDTFDSWNENMWSRPSYEDGSTFCDDLNEDSTEVELVESAILTKRRRHSGTHPGTQEPKQ